MKNGVDGSELLPGKANVDDTRDTDLLWLYLKSVPAFRALLRAVESRFYRHIALPEPVLDLGCGDGLFADLTFDSRLAAGIDPWWGPLTKANKSGAYNTVIQGFGHTLPFADGRFGSAFSNSVLEHIPDLQPVLYEIHRVLRNDGRFVVTMPSHYFTTNLGGAMALEKVRLKPLADGYRRAFNGIARHAHVDPPQKWAARFADAGFSIGRWQYYFSTKALHALEIGHLQGIPSAIIHAISGHWILAPWESNLRITERWVRPFYEEEPASTGTMVLFVLRKSLNRPVSFSLPDPNPIELSERESGRSVPVTPALEPVIDDPEQSIAYISADDTEPNFKPEPETKSQRKRELSWRLPRGLLGASLILLSLLAASIGINTLRSGENKPLQAVLWFFISASALILAGYPELLSSVRVNLTNSIRSAPRRRWLLLVSLVLVFLANQFANNPSSVKRPLLALAFWLVGILIAGFALLNSQRRKHVWSYRYPLRSWELPAIVVLFVVALAMRLVDITTHPFILSGSEASIGLDAWSVANGNIQSPFASAWLTNPTLPLYLLAVPINVLGRTVLAIRVLSPFIGAITVVATYLLGRRLWGPIVGLIAALLLAGSHVHIHYSRLGMTNIWDPLLVTAAIGLIYVAWQERNRTLWIAAGTVTGLNAYIYTSSHILPIILLAILIYLLLRDWRDLWDQRSDIFAALIMVLLVSFPQLLYYRANPSIFFDRVNTLGIIQSGWILQESELTGLSPLEVLARQLWSGLLSFQAGQDNSTAYNPGVPILGFWSAAILVIGIGMAIWRFRQLRYAILLIWTGVTLLFAGVLLESPPNSHRLLIALPAVYILVSLAAIWLVHRGLQLLNVSKRIAIPVVVSIVVLIALGDMFFYFGDYQNQRRYGDRNTEVANEVSIYLDSLEGQWVVYFYGAPSMYSTFPTFAYLVEDFGTEISIIDIEEPGSIPPAMPGTNVVYIFLPERLEELGQVQQHFQNGELKILSGYHANPLSYIYQMQS